MNQLIKTARFSGFRLGINGVKTVKNLSSISKGIVKFLEI